MDTFSVIWRPSWYELDQTIKVGLKDEFHLINENGQKQFFSGLSSSENIEAVKAEIQTIRHKYLGDILEIDTAGLTYKIILADKREILVEAEETPGEIENDFPEFNTDDFKFTVTLKTLNPGDNLTPQRDMHEIRKIEWVNWSDFKTAYGEAGSVAKHLTDLFSGEKNIAMEATHKLWSELCHQHAYVSSAALPAYDFLKHGLLSLDDELKVEILDILRGFASCTSSEFYKATNSQMTDWEKELKQKLSSDRKIFKSLCRHEDETISGFASDIIDSLNDKPFVK